MPKKKDDLTWEEPPGIVRASVYGLKAAALRARPGEWAIITTHHTSPQTSGTYAHLIRHGGSRAWQPAGHFEAVARIVRGEYRVYARYVGPSE